MTQPLAPPERIEGPLPAPSPEDEERTEAIAQVAADLMTLNSELSSDSALELAEMIVDGKLA